MLTTTITISAQGDSCDFLALALIEVTGVQWQEKETPKG